jgi:hypothetical protein
MFKPFAKVEKQNDKYFGLSLYIFYLIIKNRLNNVGINSNIYYGILVLFIFLKFIIK